MRSGRTRTVGKKINGNRSPGENTQPGSARNRHGGQWSRQYQQQARPIYRGCRRNDLVSPDNPAADGAMRWMRPGMGPARDGRDGAQVTAQRLPWWSATQPDGTVKYQPDGGVVIAPSAVLYQNDIYRRYQTVADSGGHWATILQAAMAIRRAKVTDAFGNALPEQRSGRVCAMKPDGHASGWHGGSAASQTVNTASINSSSLTT